MSRSRQTSFRRERTTFEWAILAASIIAIAAIATGLLFFSFSLESGPPDLRVSVHPAGHDVVVRVDNEGGTTAEDVIVVVRRGPRVQEVEFKAVPKGDFEEATVTLPGPGRPMASVTSYKEP